MLNYCIRQADLICQIQLSPRAKKWAQDEVSAQSVAYLIVLFLLSIPLLSYALPSDKDQVIHVSSDSANLDQLKHQGHYSGHVTLTQGTSNLRAASALTQANLKNQLTLASAKGSDFEQAHFWTQTHPQKPLLHAYADLILYHPLSHTIELIGKARIEQGQNSLAAAKISYDIQKQQILTQTKGSERTHIILYPERAS